MFDFSKARKSARRLRTAWHFQIFLMATHLFLFIHDVLVLNKKLESTKKIFHIEVNIVQQNYVHHKKICCGDKKIMWHLKEDSCWLNMFSIAQKRNLCLQKMVTVAYKYMLNWLKKFCVTRKILWYCTKIKDGVHKCY